MCLMYIVYALFFQCWISDFRLLPLVLRNSFIKLWVNQNIFPELQQGFILLEVIYTF